MNQADLTDLHNKIKKYFLDRGKGCADYNVFYCDMSKPGKMGSNVYFPLLFNRNFLTHDIHDIENKHHYKWKNNLERYDKYVLDHITPFLKEYGIKEITFTFSAMCKEFDKNSLEKHYIIKHD